MNSLKEEVARQGLGLRWREWRLMKLGYTTDSGMSEFGLEMRWWKHNILRWIAW